MNTGSNIESLIFIALFIALVAFTVFIAYKVLKKDPAKRLKALSWAIGNKGKAASLCLGTIATIFIISFLIAKAYAILLILIMIIYYFWDEFKPKKPIASTTAEHGYALKLAFYKASRQVASQIDCHAPHRISDIYYGSIQQEGIPFAIFKLTKCSTGKYPLEKTRRAKAVMQGALNALYDSGQLPPFQSTSEGVLPYYFIVDIVVENDFLLFFMTFISTVEAEDYLLRKAFHEPSGKSSDEDDYDDEF